MREAKVIDSVFVALHLVPRKKVAGISVRESEISGCDELEKRLFATIRVIRK